MAVVVRGGLTGDQGVGIGLHTGSHGVKGQAYRVPLDQNVGPQGLRWSRGGGAGPQGVNREV